MQPPSILGVPPFFALLSLASRNRVAHSSVSTLPTCCACQIRRIIRTVSITDPEIARIYTRNASRERVGVLLRRASRYYFVPRSFWFLSLIWRTSSIDLPASPAFCDPPRRRGTRRWSRTPTAPRRTFALAARDLFSASPDCAGTRRVYLR